ncbi:MAG TPA: hypothetical protein VG368_04800, partial [Acidimicrobiales bacterium]|nr:hypothetical protein [Acidimicrobiales bacterium]
MASTGLTKGAFPRADIDEYVPQGETAGVYVIGWINEQGVFCVGYVGRSDHNDGGLNARLHDHDAKWPSWTHFKFDYFDAKAAFERESRIWHDFQLSKRGQ